MKCLANRNFEWHYDAATNTGSCTLNNLTPYKPYEAENDIRAQSSSIAELSIKNGWVYPFGQNAYNDIRAQELKCIANRNYEWHYDAVTNTGTCSKNNLTPYKPYEPENDIRAQRN